MYMKKIKYILASLLAITSLVAHAEVSKPDITVTKITTTGVTSNVGFKVKDSNEWLKADAEGKWTVTSTDTPVQGAIGEKDYSGFFFQPENSYSGSTSTPYYHFTYALADINDPANGIVVDPTTTGGTLLVKRRAPGVVSYDYFLIEASTSNTTLYVIIYNGKVYGTADIAKATKFEAYQLANVNHNVSCVQTALAATCTEGGHNAVYQCSICQKYFKEQTCETETTLADEETEALGHNYQVVKDENGKATWTWAEDYSTATLHVVCANDAEHNDNKETTDITSAVTTAPTTSETGVRTYTAKVTYNGVEYQGTTTEEIPAVSVNLTLDDTTDPTSTLQVLVAANIAQNITITRTLYKDGYYNTLCLPFALTAEQLANDDCPLKGCTLKEVTGASMSADGSKMTIQLTQATALEAGKPYLIKWKAGEDIVSSTFTGVTITKSEPSTISGTNLDVIGTFAPKTMKASDTDLFFLGAENKFYTSNVEAGADLKGYRCYFKLKDANPTKSLNIVLDDEATGISELIGESLEVREGKYLENGRVVIMRNGKKYNVNGQIIK